MMEQFGVEFLDKITGNFGSKITDMPNNHMLAAWLLYQSGPLKEFGPLEQGDQIEIISFQVLQSLEMMKKCFI